MTTTAPAVELVQLGDLRRFDRVMVNGGAWHVESIWRPGHAWCAHAATERGCVHAWLAAPGGFRIFLEAPGTLELEKVTA